jgi:hypothetical protein
MDLDATGDTTRTNQAFDDFLTTIDGPCRRHARGQEAFEMTRRRA